MALFMAASIPAILLVCLAFGYYTWRTQRENKIAEVTELAKIIGTECGVALAFNLPEDAKQILSALEVRPSVSAAFLLDQKGDVFSEFQRHDMPNAESPQIKNLPDVLMANSRLTVRQPIHHRGRLLGHMIIQDELQNFYVLWRMEIIGLMLLMGVSFLVSFLIAAKLRKAIADPIIELSRIATNVARGEVDQAIDIDREDEIGALANAFRAMMSYLQEMARVADEISKHNLDTAVSPKSERDALGNSFNVMIRNLRHLFHRLESANKELEAFSYSVSHDLRAPLRHITGFAKLLIKHMQQGLDDTSQHYLNVIAESTEKMNQLINDLLALSRVGKTELKKMAVDMNVLVEETRHEFTRDTNLDHISWKIHPLPPALGDLNLLRQVWVNLISNAVKFTAPKEDAHIEIGVLAGNNPNITSTKGKITCFIKDNGVGFDAAYSDKLFGTFQRLHTSEEFQGTGIGLAIVKRIIGRHGGQIWAESELNHGASFYFTLEKAPAPRKESNP